MPNDADSLVTPHPDALRAELDRLRLENARLAATAERARISASVQALRAEAVGGSHFDLERQIKAMRASLFWRLTMPLRLAVDLARGAPATGSPEAVLVRRTLGVAKREGLAAAIARVRRHRAARHAAAAEEAAVPPSLASAAAGPAMPAPNTVFAPNVLIVAELTLPQCAKYRVWQKQEHFTRLGVPCRVVDWRHADQCLSAAALATQAILYRVPGFPVVLGLIEKLHHLGVPVAWEVDDLIFDTALYLQNRNIETIDPAVREGILSGVDLYRGAMLACGAGIASTPHLAEAMRAAGLAQVDVVENALDSETLELAAGLRAARRAHAGVVITYGSGTKTHDADFQLAAPALLRLLAENPAVRLRIVGDLTLAPEFAAFAARVEHYPLTHYARYLEFLAAGDISIAPLESTLFNDAKSNIKFLEAAILGLPSVCSPRANFAAVIEDGRTGLLAEGGDAWFAALSALANDAALRTRIGEAALRQALDRYEPAAIARAQVAPLLARVPDLRRRPALRVLFANVYFAPRSYGGATLVVEEMARRLHAQDDVDVHVATSFDPHTDDHFIDRTDQDGIAVYSLPNIDKGIIGEFDNPVVGDHFGALLDAIQPDVVHLHAMQWLSASATDACRARGIPYVITLHDAWWVCPLQFMVREDGTYCFQEKIDLRVCQNCVPRMRHLQHRQALLLDAMTHAALLLSPSEAHRQLYLHNGVAPELIEVSPNGVRLPRAPRPRRQPGKLRFAYVGGNVEVKGFSIVRRAFEALERDDWELVLVDNTLNLGFSSVDVSQWTLRGDVRILPAYTQDGMDDFFAGIDVLLFPSQWKESFGLTVREALARDVWVIATDGGGPAEAITQGVNGTLIPLDGRHEHLRAAVEDVLKNPGRFDDYRNPLAGTIMDFEAQAVALRARLQAVVEEARA